MAKKRTLLETREELQKNYRAAEKVREKHFGDPVVRLPQELRSMQVLGDLEDVLSASLPNRRARRS